MSRAVMMFVRHKFTSDVPNSWHGAGPVILALGLWLLLRRPAVTVGGAMDWVGRSARRLDKLSLRYLAGG